MIEGELPFARLVSDRMKERGLGLRELCREVSLDPSFFSKVLANKRNPPSEEDVLRKLADALKDLDRVSYLSWRKREDRVLARRHRLTMAGNL